MADTYIIEEYRSLSCKYMKGSGNMTIILKGNKENSFREIKEVLSKHPECNIVIDNIYTVKMFHSLITLLEDIQYNGLIILKLGSFIDLDKSKSLEFNKLPDYVKVDGIRLDNKQTDFSTWAHNQPRESRDALIDHLMDKDKEAFIDQEVIINDFYFDNIGLMNYIGDKKALLWEVFKLVQGKYPIDRSLSKDMFTGCYLKDGESNPVDVFNDKKGTSDGIAELLTLLVNNSTYNINLVTVKGVLKNGCEHVWNEYVDENGNIFHYDIAFGLVHIPDKELNDRQITEENRVVKKARENTSSIVVRSPLSYSPNENK